MGLELTKFSKIICPGLVIAAFMLLGACTQETASEKVDVLNSSASNSVPPSKNSKGSEPSNVPSASNENASAQSSPESVDIQNLAVGFKEGMPYGDLRKSVISGNWKPKIHLECKKNVVGDDFESTCSKDPQQCAVCDELPELNVCSGDGHCITEFSSNDGRKVLKVSTYGEIQDGLVEGEKSRLFVSWWDVSSNGN